MAEGSRAYHVPRAEIRTWPFELPKQRLYLVDEDEGRFPDLDPFLQYERCEITRAREVYSVDRQQGDVLSLATFRFHHVLRRPGAKLPFMT